MEEAEHLECDGDVITLGGFPVARIIHDSDMKGGAPASVREDFQRLLRRAMEYPGYGE